MSARSEQLLHYLRHLTAGSADQAGDALLLERFLARSDETAFAVLLARHGPMVHGVCRRVLRNSHDAEDVFQATFLALVRQAGSLRRPKSLASWLYGTAHHLASSVLRSEARRRHREASRSDSVAVASAGNLLDDLSARELLLALDEELALLPEAYRSPLILCHLEGHTHEEAARLLGCTPGSVKGRLERGRARLRANLVRRGLTLSAGLLVLGSMATAPVSASLRQATVQRALAFAAGSVEGIAANVLSLVQSGGMSAAATKVKWGVFLLLMLGLAGGMGARTYPIPGGGGSRTQQDVQAPAPAEPNNPKPSPRTDALGDPLPSGAVARMGTQRLFHYGSLSCLLFSPDSKLIVSAGNFGDIRIWDAVNGKELRTIQAYKEALSDVVFSPDGKLLVSSCDHDPTIHVWETAAGKERHRLRADKTGIRAFALSPDGKRLASAGCDNSIRLWDTVGWKELRRQARRPLWIHSLAFAPDGKTLILGGANRIIHIWDVDKGEELRRFTVGDHVFFDFALSPDGKLLAIPDTWSGKVVGLWDVARGKLVRELPAAKVRNVAFSPDGTNLASTSVVDQTLRLWDVTTGKELRQVKGFTCSGRVAFSPNGKILACSTAANAGAISLRNPTTAAEALDLPGHKSTPRFVSFSDDGKTLRISDDEDVIGFWNVATGKQSRPLQPPPRSLRPSNVLTPAYISRDGKCAAAIGGDNHILLWRPATSQIIHDIAAPPAKWKRLAFSPTAALLAATHQDGAVRLWNTTNGRQFGRFADEKAANKPDLDFPSFSGDGKTLVAVNRHDGTIHLWDVKTKQETRRLKAIHPHILSLILSADGSLLISHSGVPARRSERLGTICQFWNLNTGEELFQMPLEGDSVALSPDGKILASAEYGAIHLWEVATGRERRRFEGHRGTAYSLAFSMDGSLLASGGNDRTALVWDVRSIPADSPPPTDRQALWTALAGADAAHAYKAICVLIADRSSVSFLRQRLHAVAARDSARIARLVADLDSDAFAVRESATRELERLSKLAEPALRKAAAAQPSLEARRRIEQLLQKVKGPVTDSDSLRALRSVEILEQIGSPEARWVLEKLADGAAEARLTLEAKAALARPAIRP